MVLRQQVDHGTLITIETYGTNGFNGINCSPLDSVFYPPVEDNFCAVFIGDSQVGGAGNIDIQTCFGVQMMHLLGLPDANLCSIGATGMANPGPASTFINRIPFLQSINAFRPIGIIFVLSSQNDNPVSGGVTTLQLASASAALFSSLRYAFPTVPIVVLGNITGGGITSGAVGSQTLAQIQTMEETVFASVSAQQAAGDDLIFSIPASTDPQGPWITGTGYTAAPNGTGSSDYDINQTNAHMSEAGHSLYARRAADGFLKILSTVP